MIPTCPRTPTGSVTASMPRTVAVPLVGRVCPVSILIIVVFPDPFGPSRPNSAPFSTASETLSTATTSPYLFVRFFASSTTVITRSGLFILTCERLWVNISWFYNRKTRETRFTGVLLPAFQSFSKVSHDRKNCRHYEDRTY